MTETKNLFDIVGKGYNRFWHTTKRYRVVKGSRGSKKSCTTSLWYIYNIMKYYHEFGLKPNLLVVRRYQTTNWNSTRAQLIWAINRLGVSHLWKIPKSEHTITYVPSGQQILFRGFDDPQSITSITVSDGYLCWVWIEEAFQLTSENDFNMLDMSIRGNVPAPLNKQFTITFNPWSDRHWLKSRFFDYPDDNTFILTTNYLINEFLGSDDVAIFEQMKIRNPKRYAVEGLGNWGISEGLIFSNWRIDNFDIRDLIYNHRNDRDSRGLLSFVPCNGIDFGYNDPTAFVGAYADKKNYKIYIYYEYYECQMENRKIAKTLIDDGFGNAIIMADSEDPRTINELRLLGVKGIKGAKKGSGSVLGGIQKLQDYEIIVYSECKHTIEALSNYAWRKDRNDRIMNEPEHDFSHICISGDTYIKTIHGKKKIKDLVGENEVVYCYNLKTKKIELQKSFNVQITSENAEVYEVELVNGNKVIMTANHKVMTSRGYVECKDLTENDFVLCLCNTFLSYFCDMMIKVFVNFFKLGFVQKIVGMFYRRKLVKIKGVRKLDVSQTVYNMTVENNHNYIGNGIILKNCDALRYGCEDLAKFGVQV